MEQVRVYFLRDGKVWQRVDDPCGRDPAPDIQVAAYSLGVADAPWKCSQCGTVNEPVANACRTCGRWPSLFELEGSTLEAEQVETRAPAETFEPETFEPEAFEPERVELEVYDVGEPVEVEDVDADVEPEEPKPLWQRLASFIVPIAIVLYIVVSAIAGNDGG